MAAHYNINENNKYLHRRILCESINGWNIEGFMNVTRDHELIRDQSCGCVSVCMSVRDDFLMCEMRWLIRLNIRKAHIMRCRCVF